MEIPTAINNRARGQVADDDGRRVGGRVGFDGALEAGLVERHLAALHVALDAGAANVDPAVERAHGQRPAGAVAERSMHSIDQTIRLRAACAPHWSPGYGRDRPARSSLHSLG